MELEPGVQKSELATVRLRIIETLRNYGEKAPASERERFYRLASDINSYWEFLTPALGWTTAVRRSRGESFLREVLIPRRAEAVGFVDQITALNKRDLDANEVRLEEIQVRFRNRITWMCVAALILGFILAFAVMRRVTHLEVETAVRYMEAKRRAAISAVFQSGSSMRRRRNAERLLGNCTMRLAKPFPQR